VQVAELNAADMGACNTQEPCSYFAPILDGSESNIYVVAWKDEANPSRTIESLPDQAHTVLDEYPDTTFVRGLVAWDSRGEFPTDNARSRRVTLKWSRVLESQLQGYNVYRKCTWGACDRDDVWGGSTYGFYDRENLRTMDCVHSWSRLNDTPVAGTIFVDESLPWLGGCWKYAVRPVGPGGIEGPIKPSEYADYDSQTYYNRSRVHVNRFGEPLEEGDEEYCSAGIVYDIDNKHDLTMLPSTWPPRCDGWCFMNLYLGYRFAEYWRVNNAVKGTGSPGGPPDKPVIWDFNENSCYDPGNNCCALHSDDCCGASSEQICDFCLNCGYSADSCHTTSSCELIDEPNAGRDFVNWQDYGPDDLLMGLYGFTAWQLNDESDLKGYHVEMAHSVAGPWKRVTAHPIAWWEHRYDARMWIKNTFPEYESDWMGPDCLVFRIIAVDEDDNESEPSEILQVAPVPEDYWEPHEEQECSLATPVLPAPSNLAASNDPAGTRLQWDRVPGALKYRIYRFKIEDPEWHWEGASFELVAEVLNDDTGPDPPCIEDQPGSGNWVCTYYSNSIPLTAYYVTAVEAPATQGTLGRESFPSNRVFWKAGEEPGYVQVQPPAAEVLETVASNTLSNEPNTGFSRVDEPLLAPLATLGQQAIAYPEYDVYHLHVDHLGSTRAVTDENGFVIAKHDFLPFGEEIMPMDDYTTKLFTGHERDDETGLDYMFARYYSNGLGRFLSVDPGGPDRWDPQSWARYTYGANNPLKYLDPTGRNVVHNHNTTTYPVRGSTLAQVGPQLTGAGGYAADTGGSMRTTNVKQKVTKLQQRPDGRWVASTEVKSATVEINTNTHKADWVDKSKGSQPAQQEWNRFDTAVDTHEGNHESTLVGAAQGADAAIPGTQGNGVGNTPADAIANASRDAQNQVDQTVQQEQQNADQQNKQYDQKTNHGATEGAVLNTKVK
jgi:RHS repeat-associated protein